MHGQIAHHFFNAAFFKCGIMGNNRTRLADIFEQCRRTSYARVLLACGKILVMFKRTVRLALHMQGKLERNLLIRPRIFPKRHNGLRRLKI